MTLTTLQALVLVLGILGAAAAMSVALDALVDGLGDVDLDACPDCGHTNAPGARECRACGKGLWT